MTPLTPRPPRLTPKQTPEGMHPKIAANLIVLPEGDLTVEELDWLFEDRWRPALAELRQMCKPKKAEEEQQK